MAIGFLLLEIAAIIDVACKRSNELRLRHAFYQLTRKVLVLDGSEISHCIWVLAPTRGSRSLRGGGGHLSMTFLDSSMVYRVLSTNYRVLSMVPGTCAHAFDQPLHMSMRDSLVATLQRIDE
ncbi:hypothetical protein HMPREF2849_05540 [Corynebacterium sp. HMSC073B01]|nr:hypothetical protein HMPREF2849_05540 [Corynebacterium sp. HMSC073B01]